MIGDFAKTIRGDCVFIADGPRILNLERNYPISKFQDIDNLEDWKIAEMKYRLMAENL